MCPERLDMGKDRALLQSLINLENDPWGEYNGSWDYISYSANAYGAMPWSDWAPSGYHPITLGQPGVDASSLMVLTEAYVTTYTAPTNVECWGVYTVSPKWGGSSNDYRLWTHPGGLVNCAFLDGHCASVRAADLGFDAKTNSWILPETQDTTWLRSAPWYWTVHTR